MSTKDVETGVFLRSNGKLKPYVKPNVQTLNNKGLLGRSYLYLSVDERVRIDIHDSHTEFHLEVNYPKTEMWTEARLQKVLERDQAVALGEAYGALLVRVAAGERWSDTE